MRLPKGSSLVFQMHYTTIGKPTTDRTKMGLIFAHEPPKIALPGTALVNGALPIPAGAANHRVDAFQRANSGYRLATGRGVMDIWTCSEWRFLAAALRCRLAAIGRSYATEQDGNGGAGRGGGRRERGSVGTTGRQGAATGRGPLGRGHHDGHRRGESAAGRPGRRPDPRTRRERDRCGHCRQRHDRPDGADRQRHRRRPLHPLLRGEDRHRAWPERERLGADRRHARVPRGQGHHEDAAAGHLLRDGAGRGGRLGCDAHEVRHQTVL